MADPNAEVVAGWIEEDAENTEFRLLRDVLEEVLCDRLSSNSPEYNSEMAERLLPAAIKELENSTAEYLADGVRAKFAMSSEGTTAYIRLVETPELSLLAHLRQITPSDFEQFCADVLSRLNATATVRGGPHDGGVDFVAVGLQLGGDVGPSPVSSKAIVIGQAKRYGERNNVSLNEVRSFVGGAIHKADELKKVHAGIITPIVFAYWTTSDFHYLAKRYARQMGIWYLSGIGLAQLAIRVGMALPSSTPVVHSGTN